VAVYFLDSSPGTQIVLSYDGLMEVFVQGQKTKAVDAMLWLSRTSSRRVATTIFRITFASRFNNRAASANGEGGGDRKALCVTLINIVVLVGSESVRHIGAAGECQNLPELSQVIAGFGTPNQRHINFGKSTLNRIRQPTVSGNDRVALICYAAPSELEETRTTLQFAHRFKRRSGRNLKNHCRLQVVLKRHKREARRKQIRLPS
jgi:centromeric protein E